jgi:pseudouridine synthase
VSVNGQIVREPGTKVDAAARIAVDGRPLPQEVPRLYLLLNKPRGVMTTRRDPHATRTVLDLVRPGLERVLWGDSDHGPGAGELRAAVDGLHPVGRLDEDTEGLLLLTNDGALTHALTHPAREVAKTYVAEVRGIPSPEALQSLRKGIALDGRRTAPARARLRKRAPDAGSAQVEMEIHEGRKRQVRRMLDAVGHPVIRLRRVRVGPLSLGRLAEGEWRFLTGEEVERLKGAGLPKMDGRTRCPAGKVRH